LGYLGFQNSKPVTDSKEAQFGSRSTLS